MPRSYLHSSSTREGSASSPRRRTSAPPCETPHLFELSDGKAAKWAALEVLSSARESNHVPSFVSGSSINGAVSLNLPKGDSILSVNITSRGQVMCSDGSMPTFTFYEDVQTLWHKEPLSESGKLVGKFTWPFCFEFPAVVDSSSLRSISGGAQKLDIRNHEYYNIPHSFLERGQAINIQYELEAHIVRGRFRMNSNLRTTFLFVPITRPPGLPLLRSLAYDAGTPLVGPDGDPDGWHILQPFRLSGKLLDRRKVIVDCSLYLARPLSYTRGSPLPLFLTLSSADPNALASLISPTSLIIQLRRRQSSISSASGRKKPILSSPLVANGPVPEDRSWKAIWWPDRRRPTLPGTMHLWGEISLPPAMNPTTFIGPFCIEYSVEVLPLEVPGFVPAEDHRRAIVEQEVEICTGFARHTPKPRSYAP